MEHVQASIFKIIPQFGHGTYAIVSAVVLHKKEEYLLLTLDKQGTLVIWDTLTGLQLFEHRWAGRGLTHLKLNRTHLWIFGPYHSLRWDRKDIPGVKSLSKEQVLEKITAFAFDNPPEWKMSSTFLNKCTRINHLGTHFTVVTKPAGGHFS